MTSLPAHVETIPPHTRTIERCGDHARSSRPVLLVHGYGGRKSGWFALTRALKTEGVTVRGMSYSSFGTSVEQVAEQLEARVASVRSETGADKVRLVGHSLGGVVIAQAFAEGRLRGQVDIVVTIAAPFGGSPWARLCLSVRWSGP